MLEKLRFQVRILMDLTNDWLFILICGDKVVKQTTQAPLRKRWKNPSGREQRDERMKSRKSKNDKIGEREREREEVEDLGRHIDETRGDSFPLSWLSPHTPENPHARSEINYHSKSPKAFYLGHTRDLRSSSREEQLYCISEPMPKENPGAGWTGRE